MFDFEDIESSRKLRRDILVMLYSLFKEHPLAPVEPREIEAACRAGTKALNWNLVYLEKCGYVDLSKSSDCPPYVACSATITARGIDLVENRSEFMQRWSQDVKTQQVDKKD